LIGLFISLHRNFAAGSQMFCEMKNEKNQEETILALAVVE